MIYITVDSNRGTFFQRFHKNNFTGTSKENTYLIIVGDTGMGFEEAYEAYFKLEWFAEQPNNTLIIPKEPSTYVSWCDEKCQNWCGGKVAFLRPSVMCLHSGHIYEIDGMRFLVLSEMMPELLETVKDLEVDYILATSISDINHIGDKVQFKHCYIGNGDVTVPDDEQYTVLDEQIMVIKTV